MDFKIIIQARLGSSRLPRKVLIPFVNNKSILQILIENLLKVFSKDQIILATTKSDIDDELERFAINNKLNYFRGEESNVLKRFIDCAEHLKVSNIIRVCADNPFLMPQFITEIINNVDEEYDYVSFKFPDGTPTIKSHIGLFAEYTNLRALKKIAELTADPIYLEHVTNYLYSHSSLFRIKFINLPPNLQNRKDIRLTIDSQEDFDNLKELYKNLPEITDENFLKDLLFAIDNNYQLKNIMIEQIKKYEK
jgi:spore coat polysaccharide biosynthesis protein SpsF